MVLGHDFHSEEAFARSLAQRTEVPNSSSPEYRFGPIWRSLLALLRDVDVAPERCFFTNAFMGLRKGAANMGQFPGSKDSGFAERCRAFLRLQLAAQRPSVVLTLGTWVPAFVAPLSPRLAQWRGATSLAKLDAVGSVVHDALLAGANAPPCSLVALTHPSLRGPNVGRRRFGSLNGHAAEVAMISEAIRASGLRAGVAER
jgi:hypothetical protein